MSLLAENRRLIFLTSATNLQLIGRPADVYNRGSVTEVLLSRLYSGSLAEVLLPRFCCKTLVAEESYCWVTGSLRSYCRGPVAEVRLPRSC